jgi:hypothetical protein
MSKRNPGSAARANPRQGAELAELANEHSALLARLSNLALNNDVDFTPPSERPHMTGSRLEKLMKGAIDQLTEADIAELGPDESEVAKQR